MIGFNKGSGFSRPIENAIKVTNEIEQAKDKRNQGNKISIGAVTGEEEDVMVRVSQKMELARSIYGERNRADQILIAKK